MTVAFAMNVSVVNAKNSTGQGGTGKEFMMAMMDTPIDVVMKEEYDWKYGTFTTLFHQWYKDIFFKNTNSDIEYYLAVSTDIDFMPEDWGTAYTGEHQFGNDFSYPIITTTGQSFYIKVKVNSEIFRWTVTNSGDPDNYSVTYDGLISSGSTTTTAKPTFSRSGNKITITSATSGATIYYNTSNGDSDPDEPSVGSTTYSKESPVIVYIPEGGSLMIYAIAKASDLDASEANKSEKYTYKYVTATPTFSRDGNTITISSEEGATIHYGVNREWDCPLDQITINSTGTSPVELSVVQYQTLKIKAYATQDGKEQSQTVLSDFYVYDQQAQTTVSTPTISCSNNTITIEAESGAGIKYIYSTDGNDPSGDFTTTTNNTVTINITSGQIVKVIAFATKNNLESTQATGGPFNYVEPASAPAAPSISINHGFEVNTADGDGYTISNTLTFTESTSDANIYYTTDGTDPKSSGTRQTVSNNGQVVIGLGNNYSNVIKIRAVAELSGTYSDETTMDKAFTPELSTNGTTLSITQNDYSTYIFYHGNGETTWTCMKSVRTIDNYANIAPVSVVAATAEKLLSNIAVQNGGGTLPTSGDWDYGTWTQESNGSNTIIQIYGVSAKILRYTVSDTRGQNEPTASSGTEIINQNSADIPVSTLADGTHYVQLYAEDYSSPPLPLGVYTWKVTKSGNSYTYEYLGKNEDAPIAPADPVISIESYNFTANSGGYVYFKIEDATENAEIYYSTDGGNNYSEYSSRLALYASSQSTNGYTLYSKAELNGQQSTPTSTTFTLTDAPTVSLNGTTLSIPSEYNGFVYKVGEYWNGAIGQTSVTLTSTPAPGTTIKVRAYKTGYLFSNEVTYTVPEASKPAAPSISIKHGLDDADCTPPEGQSSCEGLNDGCTINALNNYIYISTETNDAKIYYTTDNSDPRDNTNANRHELTDGKFIFDINQTGYDAKTSLTVKAAAFKDNVYSDVKTETFNKSDTPSISRSDNTVTITATGFTWLAYKPNASSQWIRRITIPKTISNYTDGTKISAVAATSDCLLSNPATYPEAPTLPVPEFTSSFQGKSEAGQVAPFVYFGISNYGTITATEGNQVLYSYDGVTWKTEIQTKSSAPGVGCILAYASEFEGSGNTVTIYAKTVNGNNESAVVSKTYTKTGAISVEWDNNTHNFSFTGPTSGFNEIIYSVDGGKNWQTYTQNFTLNYPNYDGTTPRYVLARAFKSGGDYIYSDQDCFIGPAPIKQLKYHYSEMENWFEVNSVVGLKIRYTLDGNDPKTSETAIEFRMDSVYMDKPLCSSLEVDSKTVKTVATDGYGHFSDVVEKTFEKSDMPIFTDYGASIELNVNEAWVNPHNVIYYKKDSENWEQITTKLFYKKDFNTVQAVAVLNNWQKLMSDMLIVEVIDTPPTLTYNQNANQVTISCEEGKTLKYSTDGGSTWQTADGQSQTLDVPQGGLSVQAYSTSTAENTPETNMTTIYTSNVSTENFSYTTPTAEWTDWEPYGRGTWTDNLISLGSDNSVDVRKLNIEVRTKQNDSSIKQIKVKGWSSEQVGNYYTTDNLGRTTTNSYSIQNSADQYNDIIIEWDMDDNTCALVGDNNRRHFTGLKKTVSYYNTQYKTITYTWLEGRQENPGSYDPISDTYTIYVTTRDCQTDDTSYNGDTGERGYVSFTLKMDGMWLGDLDDINNGIQNSYMPQLSQYKIGLVKIPTDGTDTDYLDFDESGVCRIVLDDNDGDGDYDEFDDFFNSINSTERHWLATDATNQLIENSTDVYKMLDHFTITAEGAYYIVVARQVPNGDDTYSYTGAYQYMPVYYSPASNWEEVGEGGCTYQDDIVGGLYKTYYGPKLYEEIVVQEYKTTPGLYRVKNMYGKDFDGNDDETFSYQGESPYRENVYFYIDATYPNSVKLYNDMFYAQPLGVDWGYGEMMLAELGIGTLTEDENGIHIKFSSVDSENNQLGRIYEWEDYSKSGYEYDGDPESCWLTNNAGGTDADGKSVSGSEADRFDLFIPAPSKTRPNAPTINYDTYTGQATIITDVRSTNNEADVYIFYTTDGTEPSISYDVSGKPKSVGKTISFDCNQYHDSRDKYDVTFDASNISTIKAMVYCKDEDKFELYYSKTSKLLLRPEAPKITYDDSGSGTTHVTISTDLVGKEDNPVYLIYTTDGTKPVLGQHYTVGQDGVPTAISDNTIVANPNVTKITENIEESKTYNALVYWENEEYEFYSYSPITTQYCPVWRDWELYGRGAWEYKESSDVYVYNAEHTTDIEIATDVSDPKHKRIKIDGMIDAIRNSGDYNILDTEEGKYKDFIFEWDMTNGDCYSEYQYTGLTEKGDENKFVMAVCIKQNSPTGYIPIVDSYLPSFNLKDSSSKTEYIEASTKTAKRFTLKMDGLWLGDMVEYRQDTKEDETDDYAIQYSYMPQNSHYKIGLVKIPDPKNYNPTYWSFDEDGKCYINSDINIKRFFDDSANSESFVNAVWDGNSYTTIIERHWDDSENAKGEDTNQPYVENGKNDTYKMLDQFKITEEGAYYIVAARLVPNGESENETYSYSGAYRYMPVYYSPSSNWKTLSYDGMRTYRDDLAYGYSWYELEEVYNKEIEEAPVYSVEVQEKKDNPGLFRVKNMYHSGFLGVDDSEFTSYQGESSYRDGVYFYIDATQKYKDGNTIAELFPSEFYAQPLGVDLLNGEYMMTSLDGGKYVDGQIVFEDEGYIFEYDNTKDNYAMYGAGYVVKDEKLRAYPYPIFTVNCDYNDDPEYGYDDRFKLQISTPYPLYDDTPYTTEAMNARCPEEYSGNYEEYNRVYGTLESPKEDFREKYYTQGITEGQDHVDVTYERDLKNSWGTIMLPCPIKASDLKLEGENISDEDLIQFQLYYISGFKVNSDETIDNKTITFEEFSSDATIEANTPVVFKCSQPILADTKLVVDIKDTKVTAVGTTYNTTTYVKNQDINEKDLDLDLYIYQGENSDWQTIANYTPVAITTSEGPQTEGYQVITSYPLKQSYAINGDRMNQVTGGIKNKQYRAFFFYNPKDPDATATLAKSYAVFFDDDAPFTSVIDPISGNEQRRGKEGRFNVAGQKVKSGYRGIVIENGKKRFVK